MRLSWLGRAYLFQTSLNLNAIMWLVLIVDLTIWFWFSHPSPSKADNSQDDNNDETSVASCPICGSSNFDSVLELERHVNLDHGDILSPEEKRQISGLSKTEAKSCFRKRCKFYRSRLACFLKNKFLLFLIFCFTIHMTNFTDK